MFTRFFDPGHSWLCVTCDDIRDIGMSPDDFTHFSPRIGNFLFLEEDCDLPVFAIRWEEKHKSHLPIREVILEHSADFPSLVSLARVN